MMHITAVLFTCHYTTITSAVYSVQCTHITYNNTSIHTTRVRFGLLLLFPTGNVNVNHDINRSTIDLIGYMCDSTVFNL